MKVYYHNDLDGNKSTVIYKIINLIDNKVYIGQTIGKLYRRLNKSVPYNIYLLRAFDCYGMSNFRVSVIEECISISHLNEREQYWINFYGSSNYKKGYNLQLGGRNGRMHEFTKKILSEKCSGWNHTEEAKQRISNSLKKQHADGLRRDSYAKIGNSNRIKLKEYNHTNETKLKISKSLKGRRITWGTKISKAKYIKFDVDEASRLYQRGYSFEKIGKIVNVDKQVVRNRLRKIIETRNYSDRRLEI